MKNSEQKSRSLNASDFGMIFTYQGINLKDNTLNKYRNQKPTLLESLIVGSLVLGMAIVSAMPTIITNLL